MKNKIFMYLFFFAALFIIFQYMNQKAIFGDQEKAIVTLTESLKERNDSIAVLNDRVADLNYFTLQGNENAITYLEADGLNAQQVENYVTDAIYEQNIAPNGNPLVPFDGMHGLMRVNKLKFLNHKWLLADFSDGRYWGEMLLSYSMDKNNQIEFSNLGSLLYPVE